MTSLEAYKKFQLKLNKLDSGDNMDIFEGEFVLIFNEQQVKWYSNKYDSSSVKNIDEVQLFAEPHTIIPQSGNTDLYTEFTMPANYLDHIDLYALCSKDKCKNRRVVGVRTKLGEASIYFNDEYNSPSFDFGKTLFTLSHNKFQVYFKGFTVDKAYLAYYRYPRNIDIEGYTKVDGTDSASINPELQDEAVNEIIDLCVLEVQRTTENGDGFQLSSNRID